VAAFLCGLSFATVGLIEWRALTWAGVNVPIGDALKISFVANGFAHSLGAAALVAGAVRARLYPRYGVGLTISAAVTAFQTTTSMVGVAALVGVACLLGHGPGGGSGLIVGALAVGSVALYLAACGVARGSLRLWKYRFTLPRIRDAAAQVLMGAVDNSLAIGALWILLPRRAVAYPTFVADYVVAYVVGAISGIPAGAGPFEGLLVKLLPTLDKAGLAAALLGFRLIFNLGPLVIAGILFAAELARRKRQKGSEALATGADQSATNTKLQRC
jgi:phosphatidylglycerol lysyltransferase